MKSDGYLTTYVALQRKPHTFFVKDSGVFGPGSRFVFFITTAVA